MTNNAAKPNCIVPTGDDGSLYESRSSGKLIVIKLNETLLSRQQQLCQKCKHRKSMKHSKKISTWISLLKRNNLLSKLCFSLNLSIRCLPKFEFLCVCAFLAGLLFKSFFLANPDCVHSFFLDIL